jgi:hypothetical protein
MLMAILFAWAPQCPLRKKQNGPAVRLAEFICDEARIGFDRCARKQGSNRRKG